MSMKWGMLFRYLSPKYYAIQKYLYTRIVVLYRQKKMTAGNVEKELATCSS